jgi:hypothetical protein
MGVLQGSSAPFKPESATSLSTHNWSAYWAVQSQRDGTDWVTLASQHIGALSDVRALCESSGTSS